MNEEAVVYENEPVPRWEMRLRQVMIVVGRLGLAYLFFAQLFWKMPTSFGCPDDFRFTTGSVNANGRLQLQRSSGLCDWIGVEVVWSDQPRHIFVTDMSSLGGPKLSLDLGWAARLNGRLLEGFVQPNIRWFGWFIWGAEAFIFLSLFLGLFSRLGGLVAVVISGQLALGLAGISDPQEWEWSYNLMVLLSLIFFALPPGRVWGVDAWLRPRLQNAAAAGRRAARMLAWLT